MASEFSLLIEAYNKGDQAAFDGLSTLLYGELKALARHWAAGNRSLGATTLVSETYLKLLSATDLTIADKQHFMALCARIMRQIIVDEARLRSAQKRDGIQVTWTEDVSGSDPDAAFLVRVDEALENMANRDERLVKVFECRFFAGYTTRETAEMLGLSIRTVERLWQDARESMADELT